MKKKISFSTQGQRADIGEYIINRMLPNRYVDAVGPFVFLDHVLPAKHSPDEPLKVVNGKGAHPHRGIATLTYILNGQGEHFDSGLLFADEFGFEFFEAGLASEINHFGDHGAGQSAAAVIRKDEDADAANMAFPAAQLLVEGGVGDDFAVGEREQGKVASQVNVAAPIADDLGLGDAVFDEHALLGGNAEEKLMKRLFVILSERAQLEFGPVFEPDVLRKFLECQFDRHNRTPSFSRC